MKFIERFGRFALTGLIVFTAASVAGAAETAPGPITIPAAPAAAAPADQVTYAKDVASIFYKSCVNCHRPGQIAPMSLMTFKESRPWAKSIKKAVTEKVMPPWFAKGERGHFANDPSLSEEDIQKISKWVDQGATLGDPLDIPPVPRFDDAVWQIGKPDQVFRMPRAFQLSDSLEDDYENFMIPTNLTQDKWVQKVEVRPGNLKVVHHILVFVIPNVGDLAGGLGGAIGGDFVGAALMGGGLLAKYAPGNNPDVYAPGSGKKIPAGGKLMLQVHYHKDGGPGTATTDQSSLAFVYADKPAANPVTTAWILNPLLNIPPNKDNYRAGSSFTFADDGHLHALMPHMHYRGKSWKFEASYPDGKSETLLDVPNYDFDWQYSYIFKEPKFIPKGTKIKAMAIYDNSTGNTRNPNANANVGWGEATTDEMLLGLMDYTYVNNKDSQGMIGLPEGLENLLPDEFKGLANGKGLSSVR